jgi:P4 family phage/plasmid primase-like protien
MTPHEEYAAHGWVLVPIASGKKGPTGKRWNERERCVVPSTWQGNIGLAHAYSGTCAIDIDDLAAAHTWLGERGVDLAALLEEPDAVMISSGRPNRAKLLFALLTPLESKKICEGKANIIDFRCGNAKGTTVQDVLPPSIHPDTGKPYEWAYGNELVGDWRNLPVIPEALHTLWFTLIQTPIPDGTFDVFDTPACDLDSLRELLLAHDPDIDRDSWVRNMAAVHHETRGSAEGLELAIEWSSRGTKYKGRQDVERVWRSFHDSGERLITAASLRIDTPASDDDFDVITLPEPDIKADIAAVVLTVGEIPKSHHLCTDQANAQRIRRAFGQKLMVASGRFYYWTGSHWAPDEGEAYRCACRLSKIVKSEARRTREKAEAALKGIDPLLIEEAAKHPKKNALSKTEAGAKAMMLLASADALEGWSVRCEMKAVQDAAIGLLRKLLTVDQALLDSDPWLLNCMNGTIDLRTGELRPHRAEDRITKLAPVEYEATAQAPRFEAFVTEIMGGSDSVASFLQRWFGYCATGSVREQKLVVHVGMGANGKGTLLNAVADVLGEYAGTAAPSLLTGGSERHPTEIADLFGRRLVTAHETDDGAVLREGFVKQATGGDTMKGRWMRADFFEFRPTHKLQMLTNHKPQIRGQDFGIWRRVLLVRYPLRFGTAEQIIDGKADRVRDNSLADALKEERRGVLGWLVRGAVSWYQDGLNPPDSVLAAGVEYQNENDRVAEFVTECCEKDAEVWAPIAVGFDAVYPAYVQWCKASGYQSLGRGRFVTELERVVPGFRQHEKRVKNGEKWTTTRGCFGLMLVSEFT